MTLTSLASLVARLVRPAARAPVGPPARGVVSGARRRSARVALVWLAVGFVAINAFAVLALDVFWPRLRDPEYGMRVGRLRERVAENLGRPLVLVVGSSRVSMGLSPAAWEEVRPDAPGRPDPLLFNMSLVGSGPVMELMCLRRAYADGFRPAAVVFEYWPPFLREDGPFHEPDRIDHNRLSDRDRGIVRDYFPDPAGTERQMRVDRLRPLWETRHRLVAQWCPRWQPWDKRMEMSWANLDGWGWLPGIDEYPPSSEMRPKRLAHCEAIYREQFKGYTIHPKADRALREAVALARANDAKVAFVYMPEASEFRGWVPPDVDRAGREYLAKVRADLGVPLIDARLWLEDGYMVDGFHLSRQGAAAFSRRFGPAVAATFPDLERRK